eukprot:29835-Pelagococcus_subviridis.AAC.3
MSSRFGCIPATSVIRMNVAIVSGWRTASDAGSHDPIVRSPNPGFRPTACDTTLPTLVPLT